MHRHHTLSADCVTIIVTLALYLAPFAVLRLCMELGWHA